MKDIVIIEACRTAVGTFGGTLKPVQPEDLACAVIDGSQRKPAERN